MDSVEKIKFCAHIIDRAMHHLRQVKPHKIQSPNGQGVTVSCQLTYCNSVLINAI